MVGSPYFAPEAYWTCAATLEEAGWSTTAYHVDVPSFGDWGFHLGTPIGAAADGTTRPLLRLEPSLDLRFLDPDVLLAAQVFPVDVRRSRYEVRPSTVLDPAIVEAAQGAWIGYD